VWALTLIALRPSVPPKTDPELNRLEHACKEGSGSACEDLGWKLYGDAPSEHQAALRVFTRGCDLGHAGSCAGAGEVLTDAEPSDLPAARVFYRKSCGLGDDTQCRFIVHNLVRAVSDRFATLEDARESVVRLEDFCKAGNGRACHWLADFAGRGITEVVPIDFERAVAYEKDACQAGFAEACKVVEAVAQTPPDERAEADVRAEIVKGFVARRTREHSYKKGEDLRAFCVGFGSAEDLDGEDPPSEFLGRFSDAEGLHAASWCRTHKEGDVITVGPVIAEKVWPPTEGFKVWHIFYSWDGNVSSTAEQFVFKGGNWKRGWAPHGLQAPAVKTDKARDEARMKVLVAQFTDAWNRGERELPGIEPRVYPLDVPDLFSREHTRLEDAGTAVAWSPASPSRTYARISLRLIGTFQPQSGTVWPIEPWKQKGSVAPMVLVLTRSSGWWREGQWRVESIEAPWSVLMQVVH
jgi:hypothetical protein